MHKENKIEFIILDFKKGGFEKSKKNVFTFSKKKIKKTFNNIPTKKNEIRSFFGEKLMELGLL
jgi:hypothetical protein